MYLHLLFPPNWFSPFLIAFYVSSNLGLESTFSDMSVATPACFWYSFAWKNSFPTLSPYGSVSFYQCHVFLVDNRWLLGLAFNLLHHFRYFDYRIEIINGVNIKNVCSSSWHFVFVVFDYFFLHLLMWSSGEIYFFSYICGYICFLSCVEILWVSSSVLL
jgi:hypothetical protein